MERRDFLQKGMGVASVAGLTAITTRPLTESPSVSSIILITDMGAKGDGKTINTLFIQKAIDDAAMKGGGKIIIPPGVFLSGTLFLKSNIHLELMNGAVLMPSPDINDLPPIEKPYVLYGMNNDKKRVFIYTANAHHITISGGGTICGNTAAHMEKKKNDYTWYGTKHHDFTHFIEWVNCSYIRLENIKITESPGWDCHFYNCDKIWAVNVEILNDVYSGHSDGFDISGCRDVMITNCHISTGDDAIVLKTPRFSRSCERVTVTNCVLRSNCAAFKLGTECWHNFKQITFTNSVVYQSNRAFEIVSFDGADTEDVIVDNIVCDTNAGLTMPRAIHLDIHRRRYNKTGELMFPENTRLGKIKNVSITNIKIKTDGRILLTAEDGCSIHNLILRDIHIQYPWIENPEMMKDLSDNMQSSNYSPDARVAFAAVVAKNINNFQLSGLTIQWPEGKVPDDYLPKAEKGEIVIDPKTSTLPPVKFHAFWGKNIQKGIISIPLAEGSDLGVEKIVLESCSVITT